MRWFHESLRSDLEALRRLCTTCKSQSIKLTWRTIAHVSSMDCDLHVAQSPHSEQVLDSTRAAPKSHGPVEHLSAALRRDTART